MAVDGRSVKRFWREAELAGWDGSDIPGWAEHEQLRRSLDHLIERRPADPAAWLGLTGYYFLGADELYGFLDDLRDYVFGDRPDRPIAPGA
jgi:hypothetical protein